VFVIETERLTLRRFVLADVEELVALQADPEVSRFIPVTSPYGREQATERVHTDDKAWHERGRRSLAIEERATRRFLGRVTLYDWEHLQETEVGWVLHNHARGKGFATEAARACVSWGFENLPVPYLTAMIRPTNPRSIEVAKRLGMTPLRTDVLSEEPVVVHAISRSDWSRSLHRIAG
jgi:RimJ/RimL family protein N-acetyltransferase